MDAFGVEGSAREDLLRAATDTAFTDDEVNPDADFEVMIENWPALITFLQFSTQWRHSFNGAVGLDYSPLILFLRIKYKSAWEELFTEIQHIERGAVAAMAEQRQIKNAKRV